MTDAHAKAVEAAVVAHWGDCYTNNPRLQKDFEKDMQLAITAYLAAMRAEGWVMVPVVPTIDMLLAAPARADQANEGSMYRGIYRAMVEAAMLKGATDEQG